MNGQQNIKFHNSFHNSPLLDTTLHHNNPFHNFVTCFFWFDLILSSRLRVLPCDPAPEPLYTFLIAPISATCPQQCMILDWSVLMIFGINTILQMERGSMRSHCQELAFEDDVVCRMNETNKLQIMKSIKQLVASARWRSDKNTKKKVNRVLSLLLWRKKIVDETK